MSAVCGTGLSPTHTAFPFLFFFAALILPLPPLPTLPPPNLPESSTTATTLSGLPPRHVASTSTSVLLSVRANTQFPPPPLPATPNSAVRQRVAQKLPRVESRVRAIAEWAKKPAAELLVVLRVELDEERPPEEIAVRDGDDVSVLARVFCEKHGLNEEVAVPLIVARLQEALEESERKRQERAVVRMRGEVAVDHEEENVNHPGAADTHYGHTRSHSSRSNSVSWSSGAATTNIGVRGPYKKRVWK